MNNDLQIKPCPFCGSEDIRYSLKKTGHDNQYYASMYCFKCNCYGARTLTEKADINSYRTRRQIEKDDTIKRQAIKAWNNRVDCSRFKFSVGDKFYRISALGNVYEFEVVKIKIYKDEVIYIDDSDNDFTNEDIENGDIFMTSKDAIKWWSDIKEN